MLLIPSYLHQPNCIRKPNLHPLSQSKVPNSRFSEGEGGAKIIVYHILSTILENLRDPDKFYHYRIRVLIRSPSPRCNRNSNPFRESRVIIP